MLQKCQRCGVFNFHPKAWCIDCGSRELVWTDARPFGTVYATTISRSVAMNFQGWQAELPVLMCLIDLDDGARMYGQVTHSRPRACTSACGCRRISRPSARRPASPSSVRSKRVER
ncbi:MAG: OB-fold domain-containing protein [Ideonella sp.]|nr:OB-fold domain-containing protein [Ideonella sp.]